MSELSIPEYLRQRLQFLRAERLRLDGAINEMEALAQALTAKPAVTVLEPEKPAKRTRAKA